MQAIKATLSVVMLNQIQLQELRETTLPLLVRASRNCHVREKVYKRLRLRTFQSFACKTPVSLCHVNVIYLHHKAHERFYLANNYYVNLTTSTNQFSLMTYVYYVCTTKVRTNCYNLHALFSHAFNHIMKVFILTNENSI